jgi:hypothetical protein
VGVRRARDCLDHQAEQGVGDVRVLEPRVALEHRSLLLRHAAQLVGVREGPAQLPVVGLLAVPGRPAGVRHQLSDGRGAQGRAGQEGQPPGGGVVQPQPPGLHQLHDGRGGEGLGVAGDAEQVPGRERRAGLEVGDAVRAREHQLAVEPDGRLDAGHAQQPLLQRQPGVDVRGCGRDDLCGEHGGRAGVRQAHAADATDPPVPIG